MSGYNTQIRIPLDEQEFERLTAVLFCELLKDPNVKRVGRRGQNQKGVDLVGNRNRNAKSIVGIQCKLKGIGKELSEREVKTEVARALKFKPKLTEYFIVTTAGDDTALDELALKLQVAQKARGRKIAIAVWGWGTMQQHISQHQAVIDAFDPGLSPGLNEVRRQLTEIAQRQKKQATGKQVEELRNRISKQSEACLPRPYADRELERLVTIAFKRRGFAEADWQKEISDIAERAIGGDLSLASDATRIAAVQRAARANASTQTLSLARKFWSFIRSVDPNHNDPIYAALVTEAEGNLDESLRLLRSITGADAKSVTFSALWRHKGNKAALDWVEAENISPCDFSAPGAINYLLKRVAVDEFEKALEDVSKLPGQFFSECPALHGLKGNLIISSILPKDQRAVIFSGFPVDPSHLQLASGLASRAKIREARAEFAKLLSETLALNLDKHSEFVEEVDLWLEIEDAGTTQAGLQRLTTELHDPAKTLRRVRLALAYNIPFNRDALVRQLKTRKEVGGWTLDESFAAFLMAYHSKSAADVALFFDENREDLYKELQLSHVALVGIEAEVLARSGRFEDAFLRIKEAAG